MKKIDVNKLYNKILKINLVKVYNKGTVYYIKCYSKTGARRQQLMWGVCETGYYSKNIVNYYANLIDDLIK